MSEWWTYTLSDLLPFSPRTYYRLLELYNAAIWPAQIVALAIGVWIVVLSRRAEAPKGRLVAVLLAACWLWTAIAFHASRYATIHRAGLQFAGAFALEALLLLWSGVVRGRPASGRSGHAGGRVGLAIFLFALLAQPLIGLLLGREWRQVEIFGVAPDPTAVGTLGILLASAGRVRWELIVVPVLWCAVSGATLWAMESPEALVVFAAAVAAVSLAVVRMRARRRRAA